MSLQNGTCDRCGKPSERLWVRVPANAIVPTDNLHRLESYCCACVQILAEMERG